MSNRENPIMPSIGRIVLFRSPHMEEMGDNVGEVPAVVVKVWNRDLLNLRIFCNGPKDLWLTSIPFVDSDGPDGNRGWRWMPYQVQKAAEEKTSDNVSLSNFKPAHVETVITDPSFRPYRRTQIAHLRPYLEGEDMWGISVSPEDTGAGSPKVGDMIARNPANHHDQWLVSKAYFEANFEPEFNPGDLSALEKVRIEAREVADKLGKLAEFLCSPACLSLSKRSQDLLGVQFDAMTTYSMVLNQRVLLMQEEAVQAS